MVATPIKIGPFSGGLNTYSDPSAISDNECSNIVNFEIDLDSSVVSRPPITIKDSNTVLPGNGAMTLIGWYVDSNNNQYLIGSSTSGTYARAESTGVWTTITATYKATCAVQYQNKLYLIASPSSSATPGYWTPTGGFVAVAALRKGMSAIIYKERLFIAGGFPDATNSNRVFFSNPSDFETWQTSINFFDVVAGDGQHIVNMVVFQDNIVIFKEDSTHSFAYESNPSRGVVRTINKTVGTTNNNTVKEYENSLFVLHESTLYQLSNWNYSPVNVKVPFTYINTFSVANEASLSILSNRLVVHYYDAIYVLGLRTGVWTTWKVAVNRNFNYFLKVPIDDPTDREVYYAGCRESSVASPNRSLFKWSPDYRVTDFEEIECSISTKIYDFNVPYSYKRLFWWGVDGISKKDIKYVVTPITYARKVTYGELNSYTYTQLSSGTYDRLLDISIDVTETINIGNSNDNRMFIKFLKSLRFRRLMLTVGGTVRGDSTSSPLRIYSLVAFVDNKATVTDKVS